MNTVGFGAQTCHGYLLMVHLTTSIPLPLSYPPSSLPLSHIHTMSAILESNALLSLFDCHTQVVVNLLTLN